MTTEVYVRILPSNHDTEVVVEDKNEAGEWVATETHPFDHVRGGTDHAFISATRRVRVQEVE